MKVYVEYAPVQTPHGGGNQFFQNLITKFSDRNILELNIEKANYILYSGHHNYQNIIFLKNKYPEKKFIHRLDGLQKLYNKANDSRQDIALNVNKLANGTIFQSYWARDNFIKFGYDKSRKHTIIYNASNPVIFKRKKEYKNNKIKIITTSWSANYKKGFEIYNFLDENLDFNKFEYYFIGNSPIKFKNIINLGQKDNIFIGNFLGSCDIFISGVQNDACSNSIIEALTVGIKTFALNSGGNSELVGKNFLFDSKEQLLNKLNDIPNDNQTYPILDKVISSYINFMEEC